MCLKWNLLVALAAFWVNFCLLGVLRSNAVIFSGLVEVFGINRQQAAWPSGMFGFFMSITGAITGFLSSYWSIRSLSICGVILASLSVSICSLAYEMELIILFYGALQGIGIGLIVPLTHVVLNQNFSKYRAFAMGIAYSGSSAGSFVFPPLSKHILHEFDLDGTFLILGGVMLNALLGVMFFKTPKHHLENLNQPDKGCKETPVVAVLHNNEEIATKKNAAIGIETKNEKKKDEGEKTFDNETVMDIKKEDQLGEPNQGFLRTIRNLCGKNALAMAFEILTNPIFIIVSFAYASYFSSSAIFLMVVLDYAKDRSLDEVNSVFLVSAYSFGDLAGRLCCGWVADMKIVQRGTLVRLYLLAMGMLFILLPALPDYCLSSISIALGVISGGIIVNYSVLLNEYLGLRRLPMIMGFSTCMIGMSAFLRPLVIGYFRDYHQSYDLLFVFLGLLQISIVAVWFLEVIIPFVRQKFCVNKSVE